MAVGVVLAAMILGLASAGLVLAFGAGLGWAILTYVGFGCLGMCVFVVLALLKQVGTRKKMDGLHDASLGSLPH